MIRISKYDKANLRHFSYYYSCEKRPSIYIILFNESNDIQQIQIIILNT